LGIGPTGSLRIREHRGLSIPLRRVPQAPLPKLIAPISKIFFSRLVCSFLQFELRSPNIFAQVIPVSFIPPFAKISELKKYANFTFAKSNRKTKKFMSEKQVSLGLGFDHSLTHEHIFQCFIFICNYHSFCVYASKVGSRLPNTKHVHLTSART
jgi:hypothetical protein